MDCEAKTHVVFAIFFAIDIYGAYCRFRIAKKNKIDYDVIDPKSRKVIKKSYADNFTK